MIELEKDCGGQYLQEVKNFIKNIHGINNNQIVVTMDREQAKELLPIIQAFAEGKTVQYKIEGEWIQTNIPSFNPYLWEYRIKPEPQYRPFKDAEECWQEMQKHQPFGWVKHKTDNVYSFICKVEKDRCYFAVNVYWAFDTIFEKYAFADGTPFGIKEE